MLLSLNVVPYTSGKIWSAPLIFLFFWQCVWIYPLINIKIITNSNQQTQSYRFTSHIAAFLSVVLITEMLEICIQTSYDQNVQLILKSYLPVLYGTTLTVTRRVLLGESTTLSKDPNSSPVFGTGARGTDSPPSPHFFLTFCLQICFQ